MAFEVGLFSVTFLRESGITCVNACWGNMVGPWVKWPVSVLNNGPGCSFIHALALFKSIFFLCSIYLLLFFPLTPITMPSPSDHHRPQPKPNPNLLSLFLKPIIMLLLTSLFFLFLGFAAFLLLNLFLLGGAFHRLRFRPSVTTAPTSSNGLPPREINKLPRFRLPGRIP
ncbi:hypothetical protein JHK85_047247 [Glycine max]|nr:hypothetical protein JHK85_047247 [Glycine max]